jgi:hypothetical protein
MKFLNSELFEIQSVTNKVSVTETNKICARYYLIPGATKAIQ